MRGRMRCGGQGPPHIGPKIQKMFKNLKLSKKVKSSSFLKNFWLLGPVCKFLKVWSFWTFFEFLAHCAPRRTNWRWKKVSVGGPRNDATYDPKISCWLQNDQGRAISFFHFFFLNDEIDCPKVVKKTIKSSGENKSSFDFFFGNHAYFLMPKFLYFKGKKVLFISK